MLARQHRRKKDSRAPFLTLLHVMYPMQCGDTNPAPVLQDDGSVKMMWRGSGKGWPTSVMFLASAPTWKGPYKFETKNLFPQFTHTHIRPWNRPATVLHSNTLTHGAQRTAEHTSAYPPYNSDTRTHAEEVV